MSRGKPKLEGLLDNAITMLDEDSNPIADAVASVERVSREYAEAAVTG